MLFDFIRSVFPEETDRRNLGGIVSIDGTPGEGLVLALDKSTLAIIGLTTSLATTGVWKMTGLPEKPLEAIIVIALDPAGTHNAAVFDAVSQTL